MKKLIFICLFFVLSHTASAKKIDRPKLGASEAIKAATMYIVDNNIVISDTYFIAEVLYKNIYNEYESAYWSVKWHDEPRVKGGWFEIRIYNNGIIKPQYGK